MFLLYRKELEKSTIGDGVFWLLGNYPKYLAGQWVLNSYDISIFIVKHPRAVFQTSEEALKGLLSALLYIPEEEILSCVICNPIILGDAIDEKTCILDIRVLLNGNKQINLEMQMGSVEN